MSRLIHDYYKTITLANFIVISVSDLVVQLEDILYSVGEGDVFVEVCATLNRQSPAIVTAQLLVLEGSAIGMK